jgi:uncharacterized protein YdhG (YjbR/CyaY superfamily)
LQFQKYGSLWLRIRDTFHAPAAKYGTTVLEYINWKELYFHTQDQKRSMYVNKTKCRILKEEFENFYDYVKSSFGFPAKNILKIDDINKVINSAFMNDINNVLNSFVKLQ